MSISCMKQLGDFKIRKKSDIDTLVKKCMCKGSEYYFENDTKDESIYVSVSKDGELKVDIKIGDLRDIFNPLIVICDEKEKYEYLWKFRKYINRKWFND